MGGTLMIAGGGTGGHIYPAIAVAQEYVARDAARRVVFVGTEYGLEKSIVPKSGFPLEFIRVGGLKGKSIVATIANLARLPLGFLGAWRVITKHSPNAILGVGGYASGPVLMIGALRGFPTLIHEQNAFPGLTNRILARVVKSVAVAFRDALTRLNRPDGVVTGNPVRREFFQTEHGARSTEHGRRLLVFGGSQGSRMLNHAMTGALLFLSKLKGRLEIVHQTGVNDHAAVADAYRASAFPDARVVPYLDAMWNEIHAADLVIARAGAMTIGELCASGRPAILVPFAQATNNHQEVNARVVERAGGALVITESQLTPEKLASTISTLVDDPARLAAMGAASKALATPEAGRNIVEIIEKIQRN